MKCFEQIGRGPFNYQREAFRRPRKTTKRVASRKKSVAAGEQTASSGQQIVVILIISYNRTVYIN
ncbi:MAG: hypothetical protein PHR40_01820 [Bacteroidales bacterium]|nr:hypothetical protein [Bacteroidales bacterium]